VDGTEQSERDTGDASSGRPDAGADPDDDRAGVPEGARAGKAARGESGPPEVVVALDLPGAAEAREMVRRLPPGTWCKVGLELFSAAGPDLVRELTAAGNPVFLDLKLHDIPNTVEGAVRAASRMGVRMMTVHASGGREMIEAAATAAARAPVEEGGEALEVLAVTVLTSLDDEGLSEVMGDGASAEEAVGRLAVLAEDAGAAGAVASVGECSAIKAMCGQDFRVVTPGIRLAGDDAHDQKRVATPAEAAAAGADYLVVGRTITRAEDPAAALRKVRAAAEGR